VKRLLLAFAGAVVLSSATAYAHHSFAATYIVDKEIKIEGDMVQFMFRNPHSFVHVQAPDPEGTMQRWAIEWAAAGQLTGIARDTLKPGDHVIITGNPGRNPEEHRIRMTGLKRPANGDTPELSWGTKPGETFD
jgi:Family of unknown function (DUF6152)